MRTRRWVCTIRYDRRNAERLICLGSRPGMIEDSLILDTGAHSSIGGHSHGIETFSNDILWVSSTSSVAHRTKPDTAFLGIILACSRISKTWKIVRAHLARSPFRPRLPGSCNLLLPGSHALLHLNLSVPVLEPALSSHV